MPATKNCSLVRSLIPKSFHFDGYNEINSPNTRDKPFFENQIISIGEYFLTTRLENDTLYIEPQSVCPCGRIHFPAAKLPLEEFTQKLNTALSESCDFITFSITPRYERNTTLCSSCAKKNKDCQNLMKNKPTEILGAVSFDPKDVRKALSVYHGLINQKNGGTTMYNNGKKKNLFGMNFKFGMCKDKRNIAATLMGVAVRNSQTDRWYTFDPATNTRKDITGFKFGNMPIMMLPTRQLSVGDLTELDGQYYNVRNVGPHSITLLSAADGFIREMLPSEGLIPGMNFYTKLYAFDPKTLTAAGSNENISGNMLAAMMLMQWASGNNGADFSFDNITDDSFNGIGSYLPVILAMNGGANGAFGGLDQQTLNNMMMMGCIGGENSDMNEMAQYMVISQLLGGGTANPLNNLFPGMAPAATPTAPVTENSVACTVCGATYGDDVKFCPACGNVTAPVVKGEKCKKCGTVLKDGAAFCHACGHKAGPETCVKCGTTLSDGSAFCHSCGHKVGEPIATEAAADGGEVKRNPEPPVQPSAK